MTAESVNMENTPSDFGFAPRVAPVCTSGQGTATIEGAVCLCIWNLGFLSKRALRDLLRSQLEPQDLFQYIFRISRVVQSVDGHVRFDVFVQSDRFLVVKDCLKNSLCDPNTWNAYMRKHISFAERRARARAMGRDTNVSARRQGHRNAHVIQPRIVSLNVNSLAGGQSSNKLEALVEMLSTLQIDVCLLQETMRMEEDVLHRLFIADYAVIERPARSAEQHGARGLAVAYKVNTFPMYKLESLSNDFCLAVEFRMQSFVMRFASVYLPCERTSSRALAEQEVTVTLSELLAKRHMDCYVVVGGDFNATPDKMGALFASANGLSYVRSANNNVTRRNGRVIDHFLLSQNAARYFAPACIAHEFQDSFSDHFPLLLTAHTALAVLPPVIPKRSTRVQREAFAAHIPTIRNSNYWSLLHVEDSVESQVDAFVATTRAIAEEERIVKPQTVWQLPLPRECLSPVAKALLVCA